MMYLAMEQARTAQVKLEMVWKQYQFRELGRLVSNRVWIRDMLTRGVK